MFNAGHCERHRVAHYTAVCFLSDKNKVMVFFNKDSILKVMKINGKKFQK